MFPEATLFAVVLVLVIAVSFAFLLIRKPSFSFSGIPAGATKPEAKPSESRAGTRKVSGTCPNYLGYLQGIPKDTPIPKECVNCTKMVECQELDAFRTEEVSKKKIDRDQTPRGSKEPSEPVETQKILEERQASTAPPKHLQERPSGCLNFFGYLRNMPKNTLIPDECLDCAKMVDCQELNALRTEEASKEAIDLNQNLRGSEKPLEQVESHTVVEKRQAATSTTKHLQERPSGCLNFFGYLRNMPKNTLIPDECLGCAKMVECLYHTVLE